SQFQQLWVAANRQAHIALLAKLEGHPSRLIRPDGSIDIDLSNALLTARQALAATGLHQFDRVSPKLLRPHFTLVRPESLEQARHAVITLKRLAIALPALAIASFALAFAFSRERRRTLTRAGIGLIAGGALGLVAVVLGRSYFLRHVVGADVPP